MYNTPLPTKADLPTSGQLLRSTALAAVAALVLLVTTVLPAEYAVDPTRIGRVLGLTQMGEIKMSLAAENARQTATVAAIPDAIKLGSAPAITQLAPAPTLAPLAPSVAAQSAPLPAQVSQAPAAVPAPSIVAAAPQAPVTGKQDEMTIVLKPGQGAEVKLEMKKGAKAAYHWTVNGGGVNYDTHGDPYNAPKNFYHGYGKGRDTPSDQGNLEASFDGNHGWFWRNRTTQPVTITLRVNGDYIAIKRIV